MNQIILFRIFNIFISYIFIFIFFLFSCGELKKKPVVSDESRCEAGECHPSTKLNKALPDSGQHTIHLIAGLTCENCHSNYLNDPRHKNGKIDTGGEAVIVNFNNANARLNWQNSDSTCSNIDCHGGGAYPVKWYDMSANICNACYNPYSIYYPQSESHPRHLNAGFSCTECHNGYREENSHLNGIINSAVDNNNLIKFNQIQNPGGRYQVSSRSCSGLNCHGYSLNPSIQGANITPVWGSDPPPAKAGGFYFG